MTLLSSVVIICNIYIKYRLCSGKLQWKIAVEQSQIIVDFTYFEVKTREFGILLIWNRIKVLCTIFSGISRDLF